MGVTRLLVLGRIPRFLSYMVARFYLPKVCLPKVWKHTDNMTWFEPSKGSARWYKKRVGGRPFYFGRMLDEAEAESREICRRWRRLKANGHETWPPGEPEPPIRTSLHAIADRDY